MTVETALRVAFEARAERAPEPERVLAALGPARRRDRWRRGVLAEGAVVALTLVIGVAYALTHPPPPSPLRGPVSTVSIGYGPGWLPDGYVELRRAADTYSSDSGRARTWGMPGWRLPNGQSPQIEVSVNGRWGRRDGVRVDRWSEALTSGTGKITVNGHPAVEDEDYDVFCSITWLEAPDLILGVSTNSVPGRCATVLRIARSVGPVSGITATLPLRVGLHGADTMSSEVIRNGRDCMAAVLVAPDKLPPLTVELRPGGFVRGGTPFRLDGRSARYYKAMMDWTRPPYDLDGPAVMVDVGRHRMLVVAGDPGEPDTTPATRATARETLVAVARGATAGPLPTCGWD